MGSGDLRTVAVVPAARLATHGPAQLLLPWGRTPLSGATLAALHAGGVEGLVVVTNGDPVIGAAASDAGAEVTVNPAPEGGMLSSIVVGLAAARRRVGDEDAVLLVCPADLPALRATTVAGLLAESAARRPAGPPTHAADLGRPSRSSTLDRPRAVAVDRAA